MKITVQTEVGTFQRRTERTYTHIVTSRGWNDAIIQRHLEGNRKSWGECIAENKAIIAKGGEPAKVINYAGRFGGKDWSATREAITVEKAQAELDRAEGILKGYEESAAAILSGKRGIEVEGWCGRLDLAAKLASKARAEGKVQVQVWDVLTGKQVSA